MTYKFGPMNGLPLGLTCEWRRKRGGGGDWSKNGARNTGQRGNSDTTTTTHRIHHAVRSTGEDPGKFEVPLEIFERVREKLHHVDVDHVLNERKMEGRTYR